jgi:hypothetical protein
MPKRTLTREQIAALPRGELIWLAQDGMEDLISRGSIQAAEAAEGEEDRVFKMTRDELIPWAIRGAKARAVKWRTRGARQLEKAGFRGVREISLKYKGPGLWYEAYEPYGTHVCILRQGPAQWHVFYHYNATSSGSDPTSALRGGLGDAIDTDAQLKRYCELVMRAPDRLARKYEGLYSAMGQCYQEARQRR